MIKLLAFDLDGTLTQHKSKLSIEHRDILLALKEKYTLLMVGAGDYARIFNQMENFPIDIIGNYGLQYATYNKDTKKHSICINYISPHTNNTKQKPVKQRTIFVLVLGGYIIANAMIVTMIAKSPPRDPDKKMQYILKRAKNKYNIRYLL
jgi:hypothetical protein